MASLKQADYSYVSDLHSTGDKGKKRAASPSERSQAKRMRKAVSPPRLGGPSRSDLGHAEELEEHSESPSKYPLIGGECADTWERPPALESEYVPVYHHLLEIQYTTDVSERSETRFANDRTASKLGWLQEEAELMHLLKNVAENISEPKSIDLGSFCLRRHRGNRLVALPEECERHELFEFDAWRQEHEKWLFVLPRVPWEDGIDLDAHDYLASSSQDDLIDALYELRFFGKVKLESRFRLIILPPGAYDESRYEMPFRLQVEFTAFLILPVIFEPVTAKNQRELVRRQDIQRRFLSYIFPSSSSVPTSHHGDTDIPFFYSILGPAPHLSLKSIEEAIQPEALLPTLLPFQRRSVAWMLSRESKSINAIGDLFPLNNSEEDMSTSTSLFWDAVVVDGGRRLYFNRLAGALSPRNPNSDHPLGGILAEEPGLGKTLECIALVLLNPAPSRNPSISSWDPEAKLHVREVKTTLIITPPSLASQWADELALHAPTLKVLIYDGWTKLQIPGAGATKRSRVTKGRASASSRASSSSWRSSARRTSRKRGNHREDSDYEDDYMDVDGCSVAQQEQDWSSYLNTFDICITTYPVLQQDFAVARAAPTRPRREVANYSNVSRPRSPLVTCEWYRVIMDEVQMQGGGKTEEMVALIPRLSSFAVSGTPARAQVSDLIHVLKFLRADGAVGSPRLWSRLLKPGFADQFTQLFRQYAIRTMKSTVRDELTIPQQTRYLVSIELGKVERHVYDQNLESALLDLGLDARGVAASEGWQVDASLLRSLLRKLRGMCTHPQVGQLQQKGDKLYKPGALKSIADVLEAMRDQNWRNLMDDCKAKVQTLIRCAQLQQHDDADLNRYQAALVTLKTAEKEADQLVADINTAISEHEVQGERLKKETTALKETLEQEKVQLDVESSADNGKGKAVQRERSVSVAESRDSEDHDLPKTPAGEAHATKRRALQQRLRECYVTLHRVKFLQGDVCHVLGESHATMEDACYAAAEQIRRDLLKTTEQSASRAMTDLSHDAAAKGLTEDALLVKVPYCDKGGIRTSDLMDEANEIIDGLLNEQSKLLWQWRSRIFALLTQKLSSGNDEADGEEYARTLETQGEAETYLQVYAALMADRREVLVAERTLLAAHDARETKSRRTKAAHAAAASAAAVNAELQIPEGIELQPEHEVLHGDLSHARKDLLQEFNGRAVKSVMIDLNAAATRILNDEDPEKIIAKEGVARLRQLISSQGTLMDKLDADLAKFRKAFNERILYFRQLQEISDSVAEVTWDSTVGLAILACNAEQNDLEAKINTNRARQRYLDHLAKNKEEGETDEEDECCILCRCEFTRGFITQCAHVFCEGCMKAWLLRKEGKACPVCRVIINVDQMQRFTIRDKAKDPEAAPPANPINNEPAPMSHRQIHYNRIDEKLFKAIETIESHGSYGSKIQTLVRHLLYLQITDPGSKSIVFSAWADSLHIVQHALLHNGIPSLRIDQTRGKEKNAGKRFRTDDDILVLLLHGERENAGLNVTCASRVFLLESVVHHGFEIQAIARIDRMGQNRPTEVFCYYAEDTVERNILDLAARQGLSLYTKENSAGTLNVTSFAADAAKAIDSPTKKQKAQKGDFIFKTDDMLAILFPHMFEDVEYLLPEYPAAIMERDDEMADGSNRFLPPTANAIAGPSRLT